MSLFGTLRRKGKRVDELKKPMTTSLSTSTPNLHNIQRVPPDLTLTLTKDRLEVEDEFDPTLVKNISSGSSLSSASSTLPRKKGGRGFWSMVSVNHGKKKFGSAVHLAPNTSTVFYTAQQQSQSVPNIQQRRHPGNMEPGVLSGSSSSSNSSFDTKLCKTEQELASEKLKLQGIKKFNQDPKRGIEFLIENSLIERTPESVAQYLKDGEGLSKSAVGIYLGEHHDFNVHVLKAFVELHDFTDVLLVQALRQFLWSFRLPGEAQKIDRMMESFATRYCHLNANIFKNSDTCYVLSYAIIMLNTSLHNPNVKDKPTVEQFIRMNRDIDGGSSLNTNFMVQLYNSIQAEPFQIPPEDGNDLMLTFFNPDLEGWLWKQGESYKRWSRRWFILSNNCLYYFKFTTDKVPRGIIPLENIVVRPEKLKEFSFSLRTTGGTDLIKSCKTLSDGQTVQGRHSVYYLATSSQKERDRWMTAIAQNSSTHTFYTFLAQKKRSQTLSLSRKSARTRKPIVRKSQIGVPSFPPTSRAPSEESERSGQSADGAVSDATSQLSYEIRRYSEMDDETNTSEPMELTRKYSLPGHHRISRFESMIMPEIRVTGSRDGIQDFRDFPSNSDFTNISDDQDIKVFNKILVDQSEEFQTKMELDELSDRLDDLEIGQVYETGHKKTEVEHKKPEVEHEKNEVEHKKTEVEHEKTEVEHEKTEVEHKKTEVEHEKTEVEHEKTEVEHEKTDVNQEKVKVKQRKMETRHEKVRRMKKPNLPLLSLPKFLLNEPLDEKEMSSTTPTKPPPNETNSERYFTQIPETSDIVPSGSTTPYFGEHTMEKVEPRLFDTSEVRSTPIHRPHFPVRRISVKIRDRHRRRSMDKIKVIHSDKRRNSSEGLRKSELLSSPEICNDKCEFGAGPSGPLVETCNSVLINSVRHTDV